MEKRRFFVLSVLISLYALQMQAQWDAPFNQFWAVKPFYNPSFAGETEKIQASAIYRYQWAGIESAPNKMLLSANMPFEFFGMRHGMGVLTYSENVGYVRNSLLAAQYTLKTKLGKGYFNAGLQAGFYDLNFDAGNIRFFNDSTKNNLTTVKVNPTDKQVLDISAGISYTGKKFFAGASAVHINEPTFFAVNDSLSNVDIQSDSALTKIPRSYNFMAGYNITLPNPLFEIQPMVFVQSDLSYTRVQATLRAVYKKQFSGGASWVKDDGFVFFAGSVIQGVEAGYAYNWHTAGPRKSSKGSHEAYVRYQFPLDIFKEKRAPHKSIRLL